MKKVKLYLKTILFCLIPLFIFEGAVMMTFAVFHGQDKCKNLIIWHHYCWTMTIVPFLICLSVMLLALRITRHYFRIWEKEAPDVHPPEEESRDHHHYMF